MEYQHALKRNYEDYASGRVIYHKSGLSTFPVRLASEIFLRCLEYSKRKDEIRLYDPLCGQAYLLTVLALLHGQLLSQIIGSDINAEVLELAKKNLSLLGMDGLQVRQAQLQGLYETYQKASHQGALQSVTRFLAQKKTESKELQTKLFQADLLQKNTLGKSTFIADIVISDLPYGELVSWSGEQENKLARFLENLRPILHQDSVVAIISDKSQKLNSPDFIRLKLLRAGKRRIEILRVKPSL